MSAESDRRAIEDREIIEDLHPRLLTAHAIRTGRQDIVRVRALLAKREAEAQYLIYLAELGGAELDRERQRERDRAAVAAWHATPVGQEQAARVRTLGLLDAGPDAGPVCPAERTEPGDRHEGTNRGAEALSGAHRRGTGRISAMA